MKQKIFITGNSFVVTLPADFVRNLGLKSGDEVKVIKSPEKGKITYIFKKNFQLPLELDRKKN